MQSIKCAEIRKKNRINMDNAHAKILGFLQIISFIYTICSTNVATAGGNNGINWFI